MLGAGKQFFVSLILAQDERWRRGEGMQVARIVAIRLVANEIVIHRLSTLVTGIARRKPD